MATCMLGGAAHQGILIRMRLRGIHAICCAGCMKATTIKVEGQLLKELQEAKPPSQSLSAYARLLLEQALSRRKLAEAAERYAGFLRERADERTWLREWDSADLVRAPKRRRR